MSLLKILRRCSLSYTQYKQLSTAVTKPPQHFPAIDARHLEIDWASEIKNLESDEQRSVLEKVDADNHSAHDAAPPLMPTFNLAAYVNKSSTLQELIKLGVNLNSFDKRAGIPEFVIKLDFDKDIKKHLLFLQRLGVPSDQLGFFITKNPLIFKEDLDDLETRINYLQSKQFKKTEIARIVSLNPFWLMFKTQRIDNRLGFFQKTFNLTGSEVRFLATKQPKIVTYNLETIRTNTFSIKEELGFDDDETKNLLLSVPRIWMLNQEEVLKRFDYVHNTMKISHYQLVQSAEILYSREFRIRQRHEFLVSLNRAQYDPCKDLYISLRRLVEGTDGEFAVNVANSTLKNYNSFLRTK